MAEEKKKLDDFLDALQQYSVPAEPPQEAVDKLLERLAPKADSTMRYPSGRTSNKTIVKFAAAAIFFAVIIVSAVVFYNIERDKIKNALKMPYKGSPVGQKDQQLEAATKIKLQQELDQITKRYAARDVKGLIEVLDGGQYETKLAIAYFLGEIGDLPAAEAIEKYASLWTGNIEENPFIKAAAKIRNRLISKSVPAPQIKKEINDMNQAAAAAEDQNTITFSGQVVDENYKPIENATVRYHAYSDAAGKTIHGYTNAEGYFKFKVKNIDSYGYIAAKHNNFSFGWSKIESSLSETEYSGISIMLYEPETAAGIVVDEMENPIKQAKVHVSLLPRGRNGSNYVVFNQTDDNGRFIFEKLPKDSRFSLFITKQGFLDSRRSTGTDTSPSYRSGQNDIKVILHRGIIIKCQLQFDGKKYYDPNVPIYTFENDRQISGSFDEDGNFIINVEKAGFYTLKADNGLLAKKNLVGVPNTVYVTQDVFTAVPLQRGIPVAIKITDEKNNIIKNIDMSAFWSSGELINKTKTDNGICNIVLPKGEVSINASVQIDGKKGSFEDKINITDSTKELTLKFKGQLAEQKVYRLKDSQGNYVGGTLQLPFKQLTIHSDGIEAAKLQDVAASSICYATDDSGKYGKAFLWSSEPNSFDIQLEPLAEITGTIKDAEKINPNTVKIDAEIYDSYTTSVRYYYFSIGYSSSRTAKYNGGHFEIKLPVGFPVKIHLKTDKMEASIPVEKLIAGQTTDIGQIELQPIEVMKDVQLTGILTGLVLNETNEPVAGARVNAHYMNLISDDVTDNSGKFIIQNLPVGKTVETSVYVNSYGHTIFKIQIDGNEHNLKIYPQGYGLIGKPAPGLFVEKWLNCQPITLEQLRGKIILLQLGANISQQESLEYYLLPIKDLVNKYKNAGLEALIIHSNLEMLQFETRVTEDDIADFTEKNNIDIPFGIEEPFDKVKDLVPQEKLQANGAMCSLYEVKLSSAIYLIDRKGIVRACPTMNNLEEWIEKLIAEE